MWLNYRPSGSSTDTLSQIQAQCPHYRHSGPTTDTVAPIQAQWSQTQWPHHRHSGPNSDTMDHHRHSVHYRHSGITTDSVAPMQTQWLACSEYTKSPFVRSWRRIQRDHLYAQDLRRIYTEYLSISLNHSEVQRHIRIYSLIIYLTVTGHHYYRVIETTIFTLFLSNNVLKLLFTHSNNVIINCLVIFLFV